MSKVDLNKMQEMLDKALKNLTKEDIEKYFPKRNIPKGWISIEDHLPMCLAMDFIEKGYTTIKVKYKNGDEGESGVGDHMVWYYIAKEAGITHWWNE